MTSAIVMRDYAPTDEAALIGLVQDLQRFEGPFYDRLVPAAEIGPWYIERLLAGCANNKGFIRLATRDGTVVGYATILTVAAVDVADDPGVVPFSYAYIGELCVAPGQRGGGIGQLLIADCEALARRAGAKWLRISSLSGNQRACRIYQAAGFAEHRVIFEKALES